MQHVRHNPSMDPWQVLSSIILLTSLSNIHSSLFNVKSLFLLKGSEKPLDSTSSFSTLKSYLNKLLNKEDLTSNEAEYAWKCILAGADPVQVLEHRLVAEGRSTNSFLR